MAVQSSPGLGQASSLMTGMSTGAAAAANPWAAAIGPLLGIFGPALISSIMGDPQAALRRKIAKLRSPQNLGRITNQYYQNALGSPAYSQAQGTIAAGANQAGTQLQSALGARGIGTTGGAAVLSSLIPSLVGSQQAGLRTSAYQGAQSQAQQQIDEMVKALIGGSGPSQTQQYLAAGLSAGAPVINKWFGLGG